MWIALISNSGKSGSSSDKRERHLSFSFILSHLKISCVHAEAADEHEYQLFRTTKSLAEQWQLSDPQIFRDQRYTLQDDKPTTFCQIFGMSMVFFGLCPLLLGCAMAVERCVAITQPFSHAAMFTVTHVQRVVLILSSVAFMLAILPLFSLGTYTIQFPRTWCFLNIHGPQSVDTILILAFSCLGLTALTLSLLCNILSGLVLLQARFCSHSVNKTRCTRRSPSTSTSSLFCSLDLEMMAQLAVITVVSCVCWSPFLIHLLVMQINQSQRPSSDWQDGFTLQSLRMASWNQILDPWVYILLRRAVFFNCSKLFNPTTKAGKNEAHAFPNSTAHFHLTVIPSSHMTASSHLLSLNSTKSLPPLATLQIQN
ncbi:prostaglandin E2 receptor EP1 subtype-like [Solea senegalensis]|uniref:Thromboxane A2 receptor n=1 Tax=Solea senegalensis TaxID=28829 RepID=A0AAV6RJB1_SOLSE|nr:prostaglandin E2 receptor EP1 subtype-like [Solea senegalensis]